MRFGLGIVFGDPSDYPILQQIDELGLVGFGPPNPAAPHDPDEWLRRLGTLPLMHQPGERWLYNTGSYVLGALIARVTGQPLEDVLRERIFEPLGMRDTSFFVPAEKLDRFASQYGHDDEGALTLYDPAGEGQWSRPPAFPDGGAGLVSTVDDYLTIARMLLNMGRHGDTRILSRTSVEMMTTDWITPEQKARSPFFPGFWDNHGWGFGVGTITRRDNLAFTPGSYGWDGGFGTWWMNDPHEQLTGILMTQASFGPHAAALEHDFWTCAYDALDD
jgi:CubicO group peptidase (beta-lactamase class C family)